jgi:hypothetical protein
MTHRRNKTYNNVNKYVHYSEINPVCDVEEH